MKAGQDMRCARCGDDAKLHYYRIDGEDLCWLCFKKQYLKDQRVCEETRQHIKKDRRGE